MDTEHSTPGPDDLSGSDAADAEHQELATERLDMGEAGIEADIDHQYDQAGADGDVSRYEAEATESLDPAGE